jgi:hypothetical protein
MERYSIRSDVNNLSLSCELIALLVEDLNNFHGVNRPLKYWEALLLPNIQIIVEQLGHKMIPNGSSEVLTFGTLRPIRFKYTGDLDFFRKNTKVSRALDNALASGIGSPYNISRILNKRKERGVICVNGSVFFKIFVAFRGLATQTAYHVLNSIDFLLLIWTYKKRLAMSMRNERLAKVVFLGAGFETLGSLLSTDTYCLAVNDKIDSLLRFNRLNKLESEKIRAFRRSTLSVNEEIFGKDELRIFLCRYIKTLLPSFAVEDFATYSRYFEERPSKYVVTRSLAFFDAFTRHYIALHSLCNSRFLVFRHGGGTGLSTYATYERIENRFADRIIEWREIQGFPGLVSKPQIMAAYRDRRFYTVKAGEKKLDVLILGPWFHHDHIYNEATHPEDNIYVANRILGLIYYLRKLNIRVKYRPYGGREDDITMRLGPRVGRVRSIYDEISKSRFVICCKPTTVVNDCLALGHWPILFFGNEYTPAEVFRPYLKILEEEQFLFSDPYACGDRISRLSSAEVTSDVSTQGRLAFSYLFGLKIASDNDLAAEVRKFIYSN